MAATIVILLCACKLALLASLLEFYFTHADEARKACLDSNTRLQIRPTTYERGLLWWSAHLAPLFPDLYVSYTLITLFRSVVIGCSYCFGFTTLDWHLLYLGSIHLFSGARTLVSLCKRRSANGWTLWPEMYLSRRDTPVLLQAKKKLCLHDSSRKTALCKYCH